MLRDKDQLAALIARENGKSLTDAAGEVGYAAEFFRWFSEEAVRPGGEYGEAPAGGARTLVTHRPVGVAALVTPWNFPAAMATRKIAPALAAGCTVVLKPAAETPLTALAIARMLTEAGVPDGVVELVTTTDAASVVSTWLQDPRVRKVSFTGSTAVGRTLLRQAADRVLNASMELGGNAPVVVTEDADLDAAVAGTMIAKFRNGGQACTAANRIYVHQDVAVDFVAKLGAEVEKLTVGPAADGAAIGPLISSAAVARVGDLVDAAVAEGARISHRAELPDAPGHFYPPTVLADVPADAAIMREEIFGPVAPGHRVDRRGRPRPARERHRVRPGGLRLRRRPRPRPPPRRTDRGRHGRHQPRPGLRPLRALRRREAERPRPRGSPRRTARVPGDAVPQRRLARTDRLIAVAIDGESRLCRGARASGVADLEIAVDIRERYPFTFADRQATTRREPLKAGDYGLLVDGLLQATVERKSLADLVTSLTTGKLKFQLTELAAIPRAAVVVEEGYSRVFKLDHVRPSVVADGIAECQIRFPTVPIVFCETRKLAQEWTYRFLAAARVGLAEEMVGANAVRALEAAPPLAPAPPTPADVRRSASAHDIVVSDRGRIPVAVMDQYLEARARGET